METARSVKLDLETIDSPSAEMTAGIRSIERRILALENNIQSRGEPYVAGTARALMSGGHYAKAIEAYNGLIKKHRTVHTNYLGRAKARFLAGNREGAFADLEYARTLKPNEPEIERLDSLFRSGELRMPVGGRTYQAQVECSAGNTELALGNASQAKNHYQNAEAYGWLDVYSRINLAMSHLLAGNFNSAAAELGQVAPTPGSFVELNMTALKAILTIATGGDPSNEIESLTDQLKQVQGCDYSRSPLRYLQSGLRCGNPELLQRVKVVFQLLQGPVSGDGASVC